MRKAQQWRRVVVSVVLIEASRMNCQLVETAFRPKRKRVNILGSVTRSADVAGLFKGTQPDVAIISSQLEGGALEGYRVLREVRVTQPRTRTIMLLHCRERELVIDAFRFGARGVVFRDEPLETLWKCIHAVHHGQVWVNSENMRSLIQALGEALPVRSGDNRRIEQLSKRESEVAQMVAEGFTNKDISVQLRLSEHTVRNYVFSIFEKLGVSTRVELVLYYLQVRQKASAQSAS